MKKDSLSLAQTRDIVRGRKITEDTCRLAMMAKTGFPRSAGLLEKMRMVTMRQPQLRECVVAYAMHAFASDELSKTDLIGLQILLTNDELKQAQGIN